MRLSCALFFIVIIIVIVVVIVKNKNIQTFFIFGNICIIIYATKTNKNIGPESKSKNKERRKQQKQIRKIEKKTTGLFDMFYLLIYHI
jgi:hypothetical protein